MKIKVVIPNSGMSRGTLNARELMLSHAVSPAVIISVDCIPSGPRAIESNTDEVLAGSMLIDAAVQAERDGYDAFVVYCFSDLAVGKMCLFPLSGPVRLLLPRRILLPIVSLLLQRSRKIFRAHTAG